MIHVDFTERIRAAAPNLIELVVEAKVTNSPTSDELWQHMNDEAEAIQSRFEITDINKRPAIAATRNAYKALGKEPNRYRPSAEALSRRIVKGIGLYRTTTLVDVVNLLSFVTGYSIGGFDADKIAGDTLTLGVGREGEPYEAIGRGQLNIASLPVFRDAIGGIGTPTSDNERTKLTDNTTRLLLTINIYGEEMPVEDTMRLTEQLLTKYAGATDIEFKIFRPNQA